MKLRLEELEYECDSIESDGIPTRWNNSTGNNREGVPVELYPAQKRKNVTELNQTFQVKRRRMANETTFIAEEYDECGIGDDEDVNPIESNESCQIVGDDYKTLVEVQLPAEPELEPEPEIVESSQGKFESFKTFGKFAVRFNLMLLQKLMFF